MSKLACWLFVVLASCGGDAAFRSIASDPPRASTSPLLVVGPPLTALRVREGEVQLQELTSSVTPRVATRSGAWVVWAEDHELRAVQPFGGIEHPVVAQSPAGARPIAALHCHRLQCLVGRFGQLDRIQLGPDAPAFELVRSVGLSTLKPIDFFVPIDDEVVAVDDMILPKWALILDANWNYVRSVSLPSRPNEVILAAAAHEQKLVLMSASVSTAGRSQRVATCELAGDEARCEYPYEEWMHGRNALPDFSEWGGMAMTEGEALLAAGERGLIRVSLEEDSLHFSTDYGHVLDIVRAEGSLFLLVERDGPHLLALDATARSVLASWPLARRFSRFAL